MPVNDAQIEKIKYHIRLLAESLDHKAYPIASLVLGMNWSENDLDRAHDIFEKYDNELETGATPSWTAFELELRNEFSIGYQSVKNIVLAFYRNGQWRDVCVGYTLEHTSVELHEILSDFKEDPQQLEQMAARLLRKLHAQYQQDRDGADFIVQAGNKIIAIEVKAISARNMEQNFERVRNQLGAIQNSTKADRVILVLPDSSAKEKLEAQVGTTDVCSIFELENKLLDLGLERR